MLGAAILVTVTFRLSGMFFVRGEISLLGNRQKNNRKTRASILEIVENISEPSRQTFADFPAIPKKVLAQKRSLDINRASVVAQFGKYRCRWQNIRHVTNDALKKFYPRRGVIGWGLAGGRAPGVSESLCR
jgi:hypothetical protein